MPSPLTSPALLTDMPELSPAAMPLRIKPLVPLRVERLRVRAKACAIAKHHVALPRTICRWGRHHCPDNQVVDAVTVDIPGTADR